MSARRDLVRRLSEDSLGGIATLQDVTDAEQLVDAHRAEVLRQAAEVADQSVTLFPDTIECAAAQGALEGIAIRLRCMADETAPSTDLTVYRASHDSIVMGLYTTAAAARAHCETEERRSWPKGTTLAFDWIEDEEDGVAELTVAAGQNEEGVTGYIVTALTIASKYDEEADA